MELDDIAAFRGWHRDAAMRAQQAGFDIIYVYAGHDYLPFQFLSPLTNHRRDEYGGSLENRCRLLRELIEDTRAAVGDRCAVAVRLAIDEVAGRGGDRSRCMKAARSSNCWANSRISGTSRWAAVLATIPAVRAFRLKASSKSTPASSNPSLRNP